MLNAQVWHKPLSLEEMRRIVRTLLTGGRSETAAES
jgi:(2Fe-2S) ferredoxin